MVNEFENTLARLIKLAQRGVLHAKAAEYEADYGVPTFGLSVSEEMAKELDDMHEALADLFIALSGKRRHRSDCATSSAPATMPSPCDCETED